MTPEEEIAYLKDIITRQAWLEWAGEKRLMSPYVPWNTYTEVLARAEAAERKIEEMKRALAR